LDHATEVPEQNEIHTYTYTHITKEIKKKERKQEKKRKKKKKEIIYILCIHKSGDGIVI